MLSPIAAAWHRVWLATSDATRSHRLLSATEIVMCLMVTFLLPDTLRGPGTEGTAMRETPPSHLPQASSWLLREDGKPAEPTRRLGEPPVIGRA